MNMISIIYSRATFNAFEKAVSVIKCDYVGSNTESIDIQTSYLSLKNYKQ
jgi:hypothetical protein